MQQATATTVYLDKDKRKKLFDLARRHGSSFSEEIRSAIDRYVEASESSISEEEARLLVSQANTSIDNMIAALDEAHQVVRRVLGGKTSAKRRK